MRKMVNGTLSKDEIAALLAGVAEDITGKEQRNVHDAQIVLVQYGEKECVTHISVHLFDSAGWNSANKYCEKINNLILVGDEWIRANIVHENVIEKLEKREQINILLDIDDMAVQHIITKIDKQTLAVALKNVDSNILEKIKKNMTRRAAKMLEEEMEYMGPITLSCVMEAQKNILNVIHHLEKIGKIVIARA